MHVHLSSVPYHIQRKLSRIFTCLCVQRVAHSLELWDSKERMYYMELCQGELLLINE